MRLRFFFSRAFWRAFGTKLLDTILFRKTRFRYNFGFGDRDVREVCRYYTEEPTRETLSRVIVDNKLKGAKPEDSVRNIMKWLYKDYNPFYYYTRDKRETWNRPEWTLQSFTERKARKKRNYTTDCDDYAILIYNLARLCGVPKEQLRLCFMKTLTEWHLNVMFIKDGTPYAVEGTYYPAMAIRSFLRKPYFQLQEVLHNKDTFYYDYVRYLWNEDFVWRNKDLVNKLQ